MKNSKWNFKAKTPEIFAQRVRQAYADYYRHADTYETASELMRECYDYGMSMGDCWGLCETYNAEMRAFYRDRKTVSALMACSH